MIYGKGRVSGIYGTHWVAGIPGLTLCTRGIFMIKSLLQWFRNSYWESQMRNLSRLIENEDQKNLKIQVSKHRSDPRFLEATPDFLGLAIEECQDINVFQLLLECCPDPNRTTSGKRYLLHLAVESGKEPYVRALLDAGANPDIADEKGVTALHISYSFDSLGGISDLLLAKGANPNLRDNLGKRYLM